jgi:hypothetical protein
LIPGKGKIFSFPPRPQRYWGPIQWIRGALSLAVNRLERKADHSIHPVPKLRILGAIPPLPHAFIMWGLIKNGDDFAFSSYLDIIIIIIIIIISPPPLTLGAGAGIAQSV